MSQERIVIMAPTHRDINAIVRRHGYARQRVIPLAVNDRDSWDRRLMGHRLTSGTLFIGPFQTEQILRGLFPYRFADYFTIKESK